MLSASSQRGKGARGSHLRALLLEQAALLVELFRIDARTQDADDDEGLRMRLHGAHDEVRVARGVTNGVRFTS